MTMKWMHVHRLFSFVNQKSSVHKNGNEPSEIFQSEKWLQAERPGFESY
jgi:hypothetical protein